MDDSTVSPPITQLVQTGSPPQNKPSSMNTCSWTSLKQHAQHAYQNHNVQLFVFDVDHTLIEGNAGSLLVKHLFAKRIIGWELLLRLPLYTLAYRLGKLDYDRLLQYALKCWSGLSVDTLNHEAGLCYQQKIQSRLRSPAVQLIKHIQAFGGQVVLNSSSPTAILQPLADELGVQLISTQLEERDDHFTGHIIGEACYGHGKVNALKDLFGPQPCYMAFSDASNDLPLLENATIPVAITPDRKLRAEAQKRHWLVLLGKK